MLREGVVVTFDEAMKARSAEVHCDFVLPLISEGARVLDCGAGSGTISVGLALAKPATRVTAVDLDGDRFADALNHCARTGIGNIEFAMADARALPFGDATFDVVVCHSMLELLDHPVRALAEMKRVLRAGGQVAAASVEYSGMVRSGPALDALDLFYAVREQVWARLEPRARPRIGRRLREYLGAAGFNDVVATARYLSYGTPDEVRSFGLERAADCDDPVFRGIALGHDLLTARDLENIKQGWLDWSVSANAFAAFAWCRAVGTKR